MPWKLIDSSLGSLLVPAELPAGVALFCTTAAFHGFLDEGTTSNLRGILFERFGIDARLATCEQVHGADAAFVDGNLSSAWHEFPSCDALTASEPGIALGIKAADCLPVTIALPEAGVLANIHSGWRGTAARIVPRVAIRLADEHGSLAVARAFLGPSIRQCCFEVGEEVVEQLTDAYGDMSPFVSRSRPRPHVDLPGLTRSVLLSHGIPAEAISDCGICTRCSGGSFHSWRRDGTSAGRNLVIAALAPR